MEVNQHEQQRVVIEREEVDFVVKDIDVQKSKSTIAMYKT